MGIQTVKLELMSGNGAGGVLAWSWSSQDPVIIIGLVIDLTHQSTAAAAVSFGVAADNATLSDNLIDRLDVHVGGTFDNHTDHGANGSTRQKMVNGQSVTGSQVGAGSVAGITGYAYITYLETTD